MAQIYYSIGHQQVGKVLTNQFTVIVDINACLLDRVQPQSTQFNGHRASVDLFEKTIVKRVIDCVEPLDDRFCYVSVLKAQRTLLSKGKNSVCLRSSASDPLHSGSTQSLATLSTLPLLRLLR